MKISFKIDKGIGKNQKEYYCVKIVFDDKVEKVLTFITRDQYLLLTSQK